MFDGSRLKPGWMLALLVAFTFSAHARTPTSVAPGAAGHFAEIEGRCPSFHWGEVSGADHYQLVVYLLPRDVDPTDVDFETAEPVLSRSVSGGAKSWTPNLENCLTSGENYIWFVRGVFIDDQDEAALTSDWSNGLLFAISSMPSAEMVMATLEVFSRNGQLGTELAPAARPYQTKSQQLSQAEASPISGGSSVYQSLDQKFVTSAKTAIKAHVNDPTGEAYGVVGISNSPDGAGVAAVNSSGGADLVLDGSADFLPDTIMRESGIDKPFGSAQTFNIHNSKGGGMTLEVGSVDVVTTTTEKDTFGDLACLPDKTPRWNGSTWACAEVGLITSLTAGSGLTGGGSTGAVTVGIESDGLTASHLAANSVGASELAVNSVYGSDIVDGTITYSDTNTSSVQRRVTGNCSSGSAISSVTTTGTVGCNSDDYLEVIAGPTLIAEAFNGDGAVDDWNYSGAGVHFCFLTFVQLRDVDAAGEDAYCRIYEYPSLGAPFWRLLAWTEDDSDARCRANCYTFRH